jgi:hypothetical protein
MAAAGRVRRRPRARAAPQALTLSRAGQAPGPGLFELRDKGDKGLRLLRKLQPEPEPSADEVVAAQVLGPYYEGRRR